jgi:hypothetical protein
VQAIESVVGTTNVQVVGVPSVLPASKETDSIPWYGADSITGPGYKGGGGACTSGFPLEADGVTYNSTAAHCGSGIFKQNGQGYGTTVTWYLGGGGDVQDISTYPNLAYGWIYTGYDTSEPVTEVENYPEVDQTVCFDGYQFSYDYDWTNNCSYILADDQTVDIDGTNVGNLYESDGWAECIYTLEISCPFLAAPGDSGGPVYANNSNGVTAYGLINAVDNCESGEGPPGQVCPTVFFMGEPAVEFATGTSVLLG